MDHRLQLQELWHLNGGGGETQTPSGEEQEDQLDQERCAGLQEVKRSRKAIEKQSSAEALFSAAGKNANPELFVPVSNQLNIWATPPTAFNTDGEGDDQGLGKDDQERARRKDEQNFRPWHPHVTGKDSQTKVCFFLFSICSSF